MSWAIILLHINFGEMCAKKKFCYCSYYNYSNTVNGNDFQINCSFWSYFGYNFFLVGENTENLCYAGRALIIATVLVFMFEAIL